MFGLSYAIFSYTSTNSSRNRIHKLGNFVPVFCTQIISMDLSAEDWTYAGEGKVRIAFSNKNIKCPLFGTILLISKDVRRSARSVETESLFVESVMKPSFSASFLAENIRVIVLDETFARELLDHSSQLRPPARVRECSFNNLSWPIFAGLQRNLSVIHRMTPVSCAVFKDEITLEIKVKCGLRAVTPFVGDSVARLKLGMSRFHLMQLYKQACKGKSVCWGQFVSLNKYDPLMMFTGDSKQIQQALSKLCLNPQNNLRVSLNAQHVYGWDKLDVQHLTDAIQRSDFCEVTEAGRAPRNLLPERALSAVAAALAEEPLLGRLFSMQKLDLLDSEGAKVVFDRLVEIALGREAALGMLEEQMLKPLHPQVHTLVNSGSVDEEATTEHDGSAGDCLVFARELIALNISEEDVDAVRMERLEKAHTLVRRATARQCLFLLQLWMLSLIAKDASVIITLKRVKLGALDAAGRRVGDMCVSFQSETCCGTVCSTSPDRDCGHFDGYVYTVAVIDVGLKSLDKAWGKAADDAIVCQIVTGSVT